MNNPQLQHNFHSTTCSTHQLGRCSLAGTIRIGGPRSAGRDVGLYGEKRMMAPDHLNLFAKHMGEI